jgi:mRNA-degrading endonuclease RelE of RelBE toxin-antitoxin system
LPKPKKKPVNLRNTTLAKITQVLQTPTFKKAVKKLHKNQKADLDTAIKELIEDPLLGQQKKGDLSFLRVYKFKMVKQLTLLGYSYEDGTVTLELMALGSHENFYRAMKNIF